MVAKVQIQGAHPQMVRPSFFFTSMQKRISVGDLGLQGQILLFQLCRGKKDKSGQRDVKPGP